MNKQSQKKTTIFYVNSMGFMCQWEGVVLNKTENSISIKFSANKALRFNLNDSAFLLITKTKIKSLGVSITENMTSTSFDESLINTVISKTSGNVDLHWNGKNWI